MAVVSVRKCDECKKLIGGSGSPSERGFVFHGTVELTNAGLGEVEALQVPEGKTVDLCARCCFKLMFEPLGKKWELLR